MTKLFNLLYYGGLADNYNNNRIYKDIEESNRKSVIAYSTISLVAFSAMTLFSVLGQNAVSKNKMLYIIGVLIMIFMILMNMYLAKRIHQIIHMTAYLFVIAFFAIGILLAISSKEDVTASYMVFLFVTPLLFTLRPIYIILTIIGSDLFYITYMYHVQNPQLFQKNLVNAIIYGFVSIFVSTTMIRMRVQKFETDQMNRILIETDQLTGMLNRRSFELFIDHYKQVGNVKGMKACAFDLNGLKLVNDNIGHHAGDELLKGAAASIQNVFGRYGHCYRIGGDEFIAILQSESPTVEELINLFNKQTMSFKGTYVPALSVSIGIVIGNEADTITTLLRKADIEMYNNKAMYYSRKGN